MEYFNNLELLNYIINMLKIEGGAHIYLSPSKTRKGVNSLLFLGSQKHSLGGVSIGCQSQKHSLSNKVNNS